MRGRFAPFLVGAALIALALVMLLFCGYALLVGDPVLGFAITMVCAGLLGFLLTRFGLRRAEPKRREALLAVLLLWLSVPLIGAIPYAISGGFSFLNAVFESMSGFTATGATVLQDFEALPETLFMYRALSQWFGGIGILVIFIAVFPQLAIAGRQIFFAEAPGPTEERMTPRLRSTASAILIVYVGLTTLCALAYRLGGMDSFDAVAHSFTTLAAGGFSPRSHSFESFANPTLEWIAIVFMIFAGANFALQYRAISGRPRELFKDAEFRAYLLIIAVAGALLSLSLLARFPAWDAFRHGFFQVLSILTTTGYASTDFAQWSERAQMVLLVLMFIGGSAGSAGGGVKVVRWLIIGKNTAREVRRALYPRAVVPVRVGNRVVPEEVLRSVAAFITLYVGLFAITTALLAMLGADFVTAFTAAIGSIGNIGPGLSSVGPMLNYAELHPVSRGILIFGMYAGRLEMVTVFVIFTARWWQLPRQSPLNVGRR
ncbi:MAG: TrkH family potassium uptake protein [Trueperaceae bacterium]|nr:MAG: TrkH family potassium uptake protein [Trueperaceae bacterium]